MRKSTQQCAAPSDSSAHSLRRSPGNQNHDPTIWKEAVAMRRAITPYEIPSTCSGGKWPHRRPTTTLKTGTMNDKRHATTTSVGNVHEPPVGVHPPPHSPTFESPTSKRSP